MELCCSLSAPPSLHLHRRFIPTSTAPSLPRPFAPFPSRKAHFTHGLRPTRVTFKEEIPPPQIAAEQFEETPTDVTPPETEDETFAEGGERKVPFDLLNELGLELDSESTYKILIYGTASLFALWVTSAIVSALDALPLVPKVMEVVGLGFTVWFSARYLIFKKNRDELLVKIEDLKKLISGAADDDS